MQFGHIEILPFFTTPHCSFQTWFDVDSPHETLSRIPGSMYQCLDIDSILADSLSKNGAELGLVGFFVVRSTALGVMFFSDVTLG